MVTFPFHTQLLIVGNLVIKNKTRKDWRFRRCLLQGDPTRSSHHMTFPFLTTHQQQSTSASTSTGSTTTNGSNHHRHNNDNNKGSRRVWNVSTSSYWLYLFFLLYANNNYWSGNMTTQLTQGTTNSYRHHHPAPHASHDAYEAENLPFIYLLAFFLPWSFKFRL